MERYSNSELEKCKLKQRYIFLTYHVGKILKITMEGKQAFSCIGIMNTGTSYVGQNLVIM